jgi:hypothetical protein
MLKLRVNVFSRTLLCAWMLVAALIVVQPGCGGNSSNKITPPENPKPLPAPIFTEGKKSRSRPHNRNLGGR